MRRGQDGISDPTSRTKVGRLGESLALAGLAILFALVGSHHQPWFDEAQAWLIARDNTPASLLVSGVRYEGTPALWHLLLWTAQRLGLPYAGLWLISAGLALLGAAVVLLRGPFPLLLRIGVVYSYFFAYQYAIVARSYSLDLLFIPLAAALFQQRLDRCLLYGLVLSLMANTNAHSFVLAVALAAEWAVAGRRQVWARQRRFALALAFFALAALAAAFQAYPPGNINFVIRKPGDTPVLKALELATEAFVERADLFSASPPSLTSRLLGSGLTLLLIAPVVILVCSARRRLLASGVFAGLIGFSAVKYGNFWHAGIIFLAFVFCLWISWPALGRLGAGSRRWLLVSLSALLSIQFGWTVTASVRDAQGNYSSAAAIAAFLHDREDVGRRGTIASAGFKAFAVQPYFKGNIFANYEKGATRPAFYLWRKAEEPIPGLSEARWRLTIAKGYDRLLLSSYNLMGANGSRRFTEDARAGGYCPAVSVRGALVWKSYPLESDTMTVFERCAASPPGPAVPARRP